MYEMYAEHTLCTSVPQKEVLPLVVLQLPSILPPRAGNWLLSSHTVMGQKHRLLPQHRPENHPVMLNGPGPIEEAPVGLRVAWKGGLSLQHGKKTEGWDGAGCFTQPRHRTASGSKSAVDHKSGSSSAMREVTRSPGAHGSRRLAPIGKK